MKAKEGHGWLARDEKTWPAEFPYMISRAEPTKTLNTQWLPPKGRFGFCSFDIGQLVGLPALPPGARREIIIHYANTRRRKTTRAERGWLARDKTPDPAYWICSREPGPMIGGGWQLPTLTIGPIAQETITALDLPALRPGEKRRMTIRCED